MLTLNSLSPAEGSRKKRTRVGRGIACGKGKTCGRGHKGQKSRSGVGGLSKGFEGGQMPLQRRLPKFGFNSRISQFSTSIRLSELNKIKGKEVTIDKLKEAGIIVKHISRVKVFASGDVTKAFNLTGIRVSNGAKKAIIKQGGSVADIVEKPKEKFTKKTTAKKSPASKEAKADKAGKEAKASKVSKAPAKKAAPKKAAVAKKTPAKKTTTKKAPVKKAPANKTSKTKK